MDKLVKDIYGGDYTRFGLPGDVVASRWVKVFSFVLKLRPFISYVKIESKGAKPLIWQRRELSFEGRISNVIESKVY